MHFKIINCACQCEEFLRLKLNLDCNEWTFCKAETKKQTSLFVSVLIPPTPPHTLPTPPFFVTASHIFWQHFDNWIFLIYQH